MTPPAPPPHPARIAVQLSPAPEYREVPRHTDSPAPLSQSSSLVNIAVPSGPGASRVPAGAPPAQSAPLAAMGRAGARRASPVRSAAAMRGAPNGEEAAPTAPS